MPLFLINDIKIIFELTLVPQEYLRHYFVWITCDNVLWIFAKSLYKTVTWVPENAQHTHQISDVYILFMSTDIIYNSHLFQMPTSGIHTNRAAIRVSVTLYCIGSHFMSSSHHSWNDAHSTRGYDINILRPRQNGHHFADDTFKRTSWMKNVIEVCF